MNFRRLSFFVSLLSLAVNLSAQTFEAPLQQSKWSASGNQTACRLIHKIPRYGEAAFLQAAGESLILSLTAERTEPQNAKAKAHLTDNPSRWMHGVKDIHDFPVEMENKPGQHRKLFVRGDIAETMLAALAEGRFPTFSYSRLDNTAASETQVALSSVNFFRPYDNFITCQQRLLPFSHKDIQNKLIFFDNNSKAINQASSRPLEFISRYLTAVKEKDILIGSEAADFGGKTDKRWFKKRFQAVKSKLTKNGIDPKRIKSQYQLSHDQESQNIHLHLYGPETSRFFGYHRNQISVGPKSKTKLNHLARYLLQHFNSGKIVISAHTDNVGKRHVNMEKSRKRANSIKNYLQSRGVPAERMTIRAYGENKPRFSNRSREGQGRNRRAYIELVT